MKNQRTLTIGVAIAGSGGTGKLVIAAQLMNLFARAGMKNVKLSGNDEDPEAFLELQQKADFLDLASHVPDDAEIYINVVNLPNKAVLPDGDLDTAWKGDYALTPVELEMRYKSEHPTHTLALWKNDVFACGVIDGYWTWAANQIAVTAPVAA